MRYSTGFFQDSASENNQDDLHPILLTLQYYGSFSSLVAIQDNADDIRGRGVVFLHTGNF